MTPAGTSTNLTSRINGMTTHTTQYTIYKLRPGEEATPVEIERFETKTDRENMVRRRKPTKADTIYLEQVVAVGSRRRYL